MKKINLPEKVLVDTTTARAELLESIEQTNSSGRIWWNVATTSGLVSILSFTSSLSLYMANNAKGNTAAGAMAVVMALSFATGVFAFVKVISKQTETGKKEKALLKTESEMDSAIKNLVHFDGSTKPAWFPKLVIPGINK
ncbi:MAG: hypothetical protein FWD15_05645 [Alphaproteobacteria bacterium]|nr:hypothetical protein [Alphaproteobacteria bacterium]